MSKQIAISMVFIALLGVCAKGLAATPGAATPLGPMGTVSQPYPDFSWSAVSDATWYQVRLQKDGSYFWSEWVESSNVWTSWWDFTEYPGSYEWWVQTWNADGAGPWSTGASFMMAPNVFTNIAGVSGSALDIRTMRMRVSAVTWCCPECCTHRSFPEDTG